MAGIYAYEQLLDSCRVPVGAAVVRLTWQFRRVAQDVLQNRGEVDVAVHGWVVGENCLVGGGFGACSPQLLAEMGSGTAKLRGLLPTPAKLRGLLPFCVTRHNNHCDPSRKMAMPAYLDYGSGTSTRAFAKLGDRAEAVRVT